MSDLRAAARQALEALEEVQNHMNTSDWFDMRVAALKAALEQPERTLTDEVIADLWHQTVGFPYHFARAVERWLKGEE